MPGARQRESPNVQISGSRRFIPREDTQEREEIMINCGGRGKLKNEILGGSREGSGPTPFSPSFPPLSPPLLSHHPFSHFPSLSPFLFLPLFHERQFDDWSRLLSFQMAGALCSVDQWTFHVELAMTVKPLINASEANNSLNRIATFCDQNLFKFTRETRCEMDGRWLARFQHEHG